MHRRQFLALAATGLAGCSSGESSDPERIEREMSWGEEFENPDGSVLSVRGAEVVDGYEYSIVEDSVRTHEPDDGNRFVRIDVWSRNDSDEEELLPQRIDFVLVSGSTQWEATRYRDDDEAYDGTFVQPGIVREGYILFEVPASTPPAEMNLIYSDTFVFESDVRLTWNLGDEIAEI